MSNLLQSVILMVAMTLMGTQTERDDSPDKRSQQPLEIRVVRPVKWVNRCLALSIDRVNRSTAPLFLPFNGLLIESSVLEITDDPAKGPKIGWRPAYGASDIIINDVIRLAPGESRRDDYCVGPTFPVVSAHRESRREVPLRGTLQIDAVYYRAEQNWQISRAQREEMAQTPPAKWKNANRQKAAAITLELSTPCVKAGCASECTKPPVVLEDEKVWVPDIFYNDEAFINRGRALNKELARKFPQCLN
jgi:hypothetical protein